MYLFLNKLSKSINRCAMEKVQMILKLSDLLGEGLQTVLYAERVIIL
jgi:hypothetical protein